MTYIATHRFTTRLIFFVFIGITGICRAQDGDEPLWQQLNEAFNKKYLKIGSLIQIVADAQPDRSAGGSNGFAISNMRFNIRGELDRGFGYYMQANFIKSPAFLDAKIYYRVNSGLTLDMGLFKSPFSGEFLLPASGLDMVNRAQAISALAPNRQIGVQAKGATATNTLAYAVGIFNGNGFARNANDSNNFLSTARLVFRPLAARENSATNLEIGANAAYSKDTQASILSGALPKFQGSRTLFGADFRLTAEKIMISGEYLAARLKFSSPAEANPKGYHVTAGYMVRPHAQLLLRYESFSSEGLLPDANLLIFGYNLWPTHAAKLQVNYLVDTEQSDVENHRVLVNMQMAF